MSWTCSNETKERRWRFRSSVVPVTKHHAFFYECQRIKERTISLWFVRRKKGGFLQVLDSKTLKKRGLLPLGPIDSHIQSGAEQL